MKKILLSTKLKTTNIGNQALSDELIKLASSLESKDNYFKILGRPFGLDKYTIGDLDPNNLITDFEKISEEIYLSTKNLSKMESDFSNINNETRTDLLDVNGTVVKTENLRRVARKVRKFLLSFKNYAPAYKQRLSLYQGFDYYLYSAAGEISEQDFFYRQLIDLRVAQLMGLKVCAINQSIELPEGAYNEILKHVYSKMFKLIVRGDISKDFLINAGIDNSKIYVAPDTAFLTKTNNVTSKNTIKKIGVNFTIKTYRSEKVNVFLRSLIDEGYELSFISNDPYSDKGVGIILENELGIPMRLETLNYDDYVDFMSNFDLIISSRLHTNELALVAGVPILPIEGNMHKTTEVLGFVEYPVKVVNSFSETYSEDLALAFKDIKKSYIENQNWFDSKLNSTKVLSKNNLLEVLS